MDCTAGLGLGLAARYHTCCSALSSPSAFHPITAAQEADGSRRLVAFNAAERGADNRVNVFEYDEAMRLLHR